jgi:hypothetical protein
MTIFEKIIYSIPKSYDIRPAPSIFREEILSDTSSGSCFLCSNCIKPILEDSSKISCERGHVCCENCFKKAVDFAIRCKTNIVPCAITGCENNYSEETVSDNISATLFKKLSSFILSFPQTSPFIFLF